MTRQYYPGEIITMPKPSRTGYVFAYWEGFRYDAGQEYEVKEDHTFTAQWTPVSDGSGSANTGDTSHVFMWSAVLASSLFVLIIAAILRRRGKQTQQN